MNTEVYIHLSKNKKYPGSKMLTNYNSIIFLCRDNKYVGDLESSIIHVIKLISCSIRDFISHI